VRIDDELMVAALVAVNAVGDVLDESGEIMAGLRSAPDSAVFTGMLPALKTIARMPRLPARENTIIGVVATNARFNKEQINKIAQMANAGVARAVKPAHTMFDGDTMFALATGEIEANVSVVGAFAAEAVSEAIRNGVRAATSLGDVRAIRDL
jgi:L-aminopeptidase/D-esterase-like protein